MDVMTNQELSEAGGGTMVEMSIMDSDYYDTSKDFVDEDVTVVRLASDIYIENYGELGALKMGDYDRSVAELGDMASMDSDYTIVYGPQNRNSPTSGSLERTYGAVSGDNPYMTNTNREDRIHDRYGGGGTDNITIGESVTLHAKPPPDYCGSKSATGHPETQWDINWEAMQVGLDEEHPMRMYGIVLRAEFSGWDTSQQQLRRFVLGSNNLYGYSKARPLSTSGWLSSELAKVNDETLAETNQLIFQLQRDPFMDQYWQLSSFHLNPNDPNSEGSFRQFWFNTCMDQITTDTGGIQYGDYKNKDHGFFLAVDVTDRRFSGWNLIGGVNEYNNWPNFESPDDHYFESEYLGAP